MAEIAAFGFIFCYFIPHDECTTFYDRYILLPSFYYIAMEGGEETISLNLIYHQPKTTFFFLKGMFPYVCLATLPVFCDDDWPKRWIAGCPGLLRKCLPDATKITNVCDSPVEKRGKNSSFKLTLMGLYVVTQLALPWSHSVTQVC